MQLAGKAISHTKFGEGIVKDSGERYITVVFSLGEKKFLYPDAFLDYLVLKDKETQDEIEVILKGIRQKEEIKKQAEIREQRRLHRIKNVKVGEVSQAAFGFIQNDKQEVFESWSIFAGKYLSGNSKGEPKAPAKLKSNSACLLTECPKGEPETNRKIIGIFMVEDHFDGIACLDGIIKSHDRFKIQLEESEMISFWDYFSEKAVPTKWGSTEIRYFENIKMQNILLDIEEKTTDEKRKKAVNEFYQYFSYVNNLKYEI